MKKTHIALALMLLANAAFAQSDKTDIPFFSGSEKIQGVDLFETESKSTPAASATSGKTTKTTTIKGVEALPLHPAPAKQQIVSNPEVLAPAPAAAAQAKKLPAADAARLAAAKRWEQSGQAEALVGAGGAVEYPYGFSRPTITCAPLHVCSVALQNGEAVTSVSLGDTVRWLLQTATAGSKPVLMIKPTQAGLSTNLVVTTDKGRIYYMHLVASKTEYVPMVTFYDPSEMTRDMNAEAQAMARQKAEFEASIAATKLAAEQAKASRVVADKSVGKLDPTSLDFGYTCKGDATFKPSRVFSNDTHTFIQLPPGSNASDAPAVFNLSSGSEPELLNSRLVNGYYIVDGKPTKINLVLGLDSKAQIVTCEKNSARSDFSYFSQY